MSTEFFNDQWRIPSNENQNKVSNYSMEFDGTSGEIDLGSEVLFDSTKGFSFSTWIKLDAYSPLYPGICRLKTDQSTGYQIFLSERLNYTGINIGSDSNFIRLRTTGDISGDFIGTWKHVCLTFDGVDRTALSSYKIYVDGSPVGLVSNGNFQAVPNSNRLGIGNVSSTEFNGKIDQVNIFDYELSASQVSTLYGGGTAITNPMSLSPKPIAYYQLGDQSVYNGANYLVPNNSLSDYVFNIDSSNVNYIDLGTNPFSFTQNLTVSFWMKSTQTALNTFIGKDVSVSGGRNWMVMLYQNKVYFWTTSTGSISNLKDIQSNVAGVVSDGKWHHIVCVNNQTNVTKQIYIDGVLDVTNSNGGLISTSSSPVQIGKRPSGSPYDGEMSNVALWDTALTGTQVETLYNNGAPNNISSLSPVAWYKLNAADTFDSSTSTWTITDYGSGGNDGTSFYMTSANLVTSDLQQTSGYSPYALDFDGINDYLDCGNDSSLSISGDLTISAWVYINVHKQLNGIISKISSTDRNYEILVRSTENITFYTQTSGTSVFTSSTTTIPVNTWTHIAVTVQNGVTNGTKFYFNGVQDATTGTHTIVGNTANLNIGRRTTNSFYINGKLSNVALWNTNLSSTEITEIFNEGVPSNLNNFSGTAPVSWWQLGSNSSFNTNWTCLDEIGTNNAVSANMTNVDIVDGVGYSASGIGNSSIDIKGDAPYSTANGLSNSMDVLDRTEDTPS